jgi:hypothetical protein
MKEFEGYLFSRLHLIGSKSEGPVYYLQTPSYSEVKINKQAQSWAKDKILHDVLDSWVKVTGELEEDVSITYANVEQRIGVLRDSIVEPVKVEVLCLVNPIVVNKQPIIGESPSQSVIVQVIVTNTLDIALEDYHSSPLPIQVSLKDPKGQIVAHFPDKVIWLMTRIPLPAKTPVTYTGLLPINPNKFAIEGEYSLSGKYLPRGLEESIPVEVKFVW